MSEKLRFAFYWAASCGGCEIAVLDINEKILDVVAHADIVFWPVAMDIKYKDVEAMPDQSIDVCFFNGAIRNSENEHMAKLLRTKAKILLPSVHAPMKAASQASPTCTTRRRYSKGSTMKPHRQKTRRA